MLFRSLILILCTTIVCRLVQCKVYRLPKNIKPIRYVLTMEPNLGQHAYHGSVIIEIKVLENTNSITLHKKGLTIAENDVHLVSSNGEEMQLENTLENYETETLKISLANVLLKNNYYHLKIANFTRGFAHTAGFFVVNGNFASSGTIALTHFEPTGARTAFPCFDEPGLKAKFVINLIRNEGYQSLSNEALENTEYLGDGRFKDTFKETPDMPTYAVAFIVTNFKSTQTVERHRVFAAHEAIESGKLEYALNVGVKTLKALENFIGISYALNKIDQVAVRHFPVHAMENWGLVIYREMFLLVDNYTNIEKLQNTNCYIAHEFAHQWFGNLVTADWWDYLWLSEALAAYFHYHIASVVEPSWRLKDQFLIKMVHSAFIHEEDNPGPLNYPIAHSGEYPPLHIMYEKGSAIIRMIEHFLTYDIFRRGLQIYIQNNKFKSVVPADLYSALQQAVDEAKVNHLLSNMSVAHILTTWDSKKGFPTVTVSRNYSTGSITIQQYSNVDSDWIVPINYAFSLDNKTDFSKTSADYWLTKESVTIDNFPTGGWMLINKQQSGYYRVNYDLENWNRLIDFMKTENFTYIHVLNRAQLIDDSFSLAYHKIIPWEIPLRLCDYLVRERDYIPFAAFYNALEQHINFNYIQIHYSRSNFVFFENYTLANKISDNPTEIEVYREYVNTTLSGITDYLEALEESNRTHLDHLHISKLKTRQRG